MASDTATKKPKIKRPFKPVEFIAGLMRSRITLTILLINALALTIIVIGATRLGGLRDRLVKERVSMLSIQATVLAHSIAETATDEDGSGLLIEKIPGVLQSIYIPSGTRVRVFNSIGEPIEDADSFNIQSRIESSYLPDLDPGFVERIRDLAPSFGDIQVSSGMSYETLEEEISAALELRPEATRTTDSTEPPYVYSERRMSDGQIVVSVSVPIQRVQLVRGVLNVQSGGVDSIVQEQRRFIFVVALLAAAVAVGASILGALSITLPVRRLAEAAHRIRTEGPGNANIPRIPGKWEVGRLSEAMAKMTDALVERMHAIQSFSTDVAHELKNPMCSLRSAVETLPTIRDAERQERLLRVMHRDLIRLDRLITEISRAGRVDAELANSRADPLDLQSFLVDLVEMYSVTRSQGEPDVVFSQDIPTHSARVRAAEEPLSHVFRNVIDNARTYSPADRPVRITLRHEVNGGRPMAVAEVEDGGPGVPEENLDRIFDRFYTERSNGSGNDNRDHSGLGLAIAKQIIEAHDGRIWASNIPGGNGKSAGARFTIALPLDR